MDRSCVAEIKVPSYAGHYLYYPIIREMMAMAVEDMTAVKLDYCEIKRQMVDGSFVSSQMHECKYHCTRIIWT